MIRTLKFLLLGSAALAAAACTAPNREPDLSNIQANVDKTREGDFGDFLYNLVEAEDKAREAEGIKAAIDEHPGYLYTNLPLRQRGVQLSEEAADHRAKAEAALNRILDPIRARLAYLESLHVPQDVGPMKVSIYFDTGKAALRDGDMAALTQAGNFLSQYPIAHVQIDAFTDTVGSENANKALAKRRAKAAMDALAEAGVPLSADVAVKAVGEPEGAADNEDNQENRRVDIIVQPHGTYNAGM
jgi:outer membrane protein OmpA-like peptidoglycan-associated protein